jgi:hypothetical protein
MRFTVLLGATLLCLGAMASAEAKDISAADIKLCKWGAGIAGQAQQAKLSGKTLYSTRKHVLERKFANPSMSKMAVGITNQTFASKSRVKPAVVSKTYLDGCIAHERRQRAAATAKAKPKPTSLSVSKHAH